MICRSWSQNDITVFESLLGRCFMTVNQIIKVKAGVGGWSGKDQIKSSVV